MKLLSIDPGREKCGFAVLDDSRRLLEHQVIPTTNVENAFKTWISRWSPERVLLGDGTFSKMIRQAIEPHLKKTPIEVVDEHDSTYRARKLYFQHNPPKGIWRFIPLTLQVPPEPYDDFAAALLALRFLEKGSGEK